MSDRVDVLAIAGDHGMLTSSIQRVTVESDVEFDIKIPPTIVRCVEALSVHDAQRGDIGAAVRPADEIVVIRNGQIVRRVRGGELEGLTRSVKEASLRATLRWWVASGGK